MAGAAPAARLRRPPGAREEGNPAERRGALTEPRWVRALLLGTALTFLGFFLFIPLALVFAKAFAGGLAAYWAAIRDPVTMISVRAASGSAAAAGACCAKA